jgi:hypothetical protein
VASSKSMLAVGLAAATLVVIVVVLAMGAAVRAGLAPWPGIAVAVLAIAAFAVSRERSSLVVAGLLAASGVVGVVYGLMRTDFLMASSFPGPIFGIILGLPNPRAGHGRGCCSHPGPKKLYEVARRSAVPGAGCRDGTLTSGVGWWA